MSTFIMLKDVVPKDGGNTYQNLMLTCLKLASTPSCKLVYANYLIPYYFIFMYTDVGHHYSSTINYVYILCIFNCHGICM